MANLGYNKFCGIEHVPGEPKRILPQLSSPHINTSRIHCFIFVPNVLVQILIIVLKLDQLPEFQS